jgi:hypothetical protein
MHYLLLILVASSQTSVFAPTQALTVGFDSISACQFAAGWVANEQVKATCIPTDETMWHQPDRPKIVVQKESPK